jgi:dynein heavy chain
MIWNVNKDTFFRRWQQQAPRVADFDQSITQYIELSNKVQGVDTLSNQEFILLDCSPLKFSAISHCDEWQNRFHGLLLSMATNKLHDICTSLDENSKTYVCMTGQG